MRVIVTGAGGFIGRYTVAELRRRGHDVDAVVRPDGNSPAQLADDPGVTIVRADLRTAAGVDAVARRLPKAGAAIHLAAAMRGSRRDRFDATVLATERLLDAIAAVDWRGRLVHVSSFAVYDYGALRRGATVDERTALEPSPGRRDDYAWTKCWQERIVREAAARGAVEATIVRPGAVYGRERRAQPRLGRMLGARTLLLVGVGQPLPLSYVENTASLLAECAEHPRAAGEVFNAVDPVGLRQWQYARRWRASGDGPRRVLALPLPAFRALSAGYRAAQRATRGAVRVPGMLDPDVAAPNVRRLRWRADRAPALLGWRPPVALQAALERTFGGRDG